MKIASSLLILVVFMAFASGLQGYTVPGVETDEILMSIHVWGEIRNPGTYLVPVGSDLIVGISAAGGPTQHASLGDVSIVYEDLEIEYDLHNFLDAEGDPVPELLPGATIFIRTRSYEWWKEAIDFTYKIVVAVNLIWILIDR